MVLGYEQIQSATAYVKDRLGGLQPVLGVVLGSGPVSYTHLTLPTIYSV